LAFHSPGTVYFKTQGSLVNIGYRHNVSKSVLNDVYADVGSDWEGYKPMEVSERKMGTRQRRIRGVEYE
jgi:hypothetical protein